MTYITLFGFFQRVFMSTKLITALDRTEFLLQQKDKSPYHYENLILHNITLRT